MPSIDSAEENDEEKAELTVPQPIRSGRGKNAPLRCSQLVYEFAGPRAFFTKVVDYDEPKHFKPAKKAVQDEIEKMRRFGVSAWKGVPRTQVSKDPNAQLVRSCIVMGIKNCELTKLREKWKARFIAIGCMLRDAMGGKESHPDSSLTPRYRSRLSELLCEMTLEWTLVRYLQTSNPNTSSLHTGH